jgi:hypothetical protein
MNCPQWEERIAAWIGEPLPFDVEQHLAECPGCSEFARELEDDAAAFAEPVPEPDFGAMRRSLAAAIVRRRRARVWIPAGLAAAAAALLLMARLSHPVVQSRRPDVAHELKKRTPLAESAETQAHTASPLAVRHRGRARSRRAVQPRATAHADAAELALLLQAATGLGPADSGSESPVEMRIETDNPKVTIILLQVKEGSYE